MSQRAAFSRHRKPVARTKVRAKHRRSRWNRAALVFESLEHRVPPGSMLFDLLGAEATAATSYWTGSNSSQNPAARRPPASGADPAMAHDTSGDHGVSLVENRGLRTPSRGLMERLFRRGATSPSATAAGPGDVSGAPQQPATSAITVGLGIDIQGELDAWFETNLEPAEDASKTFLAGRLDCEPSPIEPCFNIPPMATGPLGGDLSGLGDETRTAGATLAARSVEAAPYLPSWAAAEPPSAGEAEHSPSPSGSPSASPSGSPSEAAPAAQVAPADAASTARRQTVRASIGSTARLGFEQGLDGWTASQSGGSLDGMGAVTSGSAVLREGDSFLVTLQQDFTVPDQPLSISFVYTASFDTTDPDFINDAFEVALTDADGYSLVDTFDAQRDAFFNLTEDLPVALGAKTTQTTVSQGNEVTLDISDVPPGIEATLTFRLVNNDSDTESTVTILSVDIVSMATPPSVTIGLLNDTAPAGPGSEPYRTDLLTNDPTVTGTATDDEAVVQLEAQVNDGPFVDITAALTGDTYTFDPGPLPPGPHRITVRATDQQGNAGSSSLDFRVNTPPVAKAGPDRTVDEGSQVTFDASASLDADDVLFAYQWTFHGSPTVAGISASRFYLQDGVYQVSLTVTDTAGSTATHIIDVVVANVPPTVVTATDLAGLQGDSLNLIATFTDPGILDTHTASIDWGDGTITPATVDQASGGGTVTASHIYNSGGTFTIRVQVTDDAGDSGFRLATAAIEHLSTGSISGYVYLDVNNNGIKDPPEQPLPNVPIMLSGTVSRTVVTAADGSYLFDELPPGVYEIVESQPLAFDDGRDTQGTPLLGSVANNRFYDIQLGADVHAVNYNFGELGLRAPFIGKQLLLASTPPAGGLLAELMVPGGNWYGFQAPRDGTARISVPADVGDPVIQIYTANMGPLSMSQGQHLLTAPVLQGQQYVLHVSGQGGEAEFEPTLQFDMTRPPAPLVGRTNPLNPLDTNADGLVTPQDALILINVLNGTSAIAAQTTNDYYLDVDGNGLVTPADVLIVINHLNANIAPATWSGEGEATLLERPAADAPSVSSAPTPDAVSNPRATPASFLASQVIAMLGAEGESGSNRPVQSSEGDTLLGPDDSVLFTTSEDFLNGTLFNLNVTEVPDELRLNPPEEIQTYPYIWIANSAEGTISRFDTRTGQEIGRYRTGPAAGTDPSRIVVTADGDAWVVNRGDNATNWGNVVKILREGFVDRNGNGVMDTSQDLDGDGYVTGAEVLPWDADGDGQPDDERIALVLHAGRDRNDTSKWTYGGIARAVAVDIYGKLWVGVYNRSQYEVFDAATGAFERIVSVNGRPYGAVIAPNGILYSANSGSRYLDAIDTHTQTYLGQIDVQSGMYGITVDPEGVIWLSPYSGTRLIRYDTNTGEVITYPSPKGDSGAGITVDRLGNVWAGKHNDSGMLKWEFAEDHKTLVNSQFIAIPEARAAKAASIDADGYVWTVALNADKAFKIDPVTNAVVMTRNTGRGPYNYSDMTGHIRIGSTENTGTWTEIIDSEQFGQPWGTVALDKTAPYGTDVSLRVRASDERSLLNAVSWSEVQPGQPLNDFRGRYLQVQIKMTAGKGADVPAVQTVAVAAIAPPAIVVHQPTDGAALTAGQRVVISGTASAQTQVGPGSTSVPNRIVAVLINNSAVDVLDAAGNFFAQVDVLPGENVFDLTAIDAYGQMAATRVTVIGSQASTGHVDLLFDVSPSFAPLYARTSFEPRSSQLFAELAIHNVGQYPADNPFYVGVRNISDPTVSVREAVGRTRDGIPYYDFSKVIPGNSLNPDDVTGFVHAVFHNPNRVQFTYELVFLAKLNEPPVFITSPIVETHPGWNYRYDADARDPDGDTLIYDLLVGPSSMSVGEATGQLTWLPTLADLGVHAVVINVTDGRGGSAEQRYLLSVSESLPNRPPVITSLPVVEAVVNAGYRYDVVAVDADSDTLNYKLLASDFTGYRQTVLDDQPVGYWRLERTTLKTAVDETGQGFDGRYENAPSFQSGAIAQTSDAAVQFNGIDQHITIPDSGRLTPQQLTVEAWVNPSAFDNNGKVLMKGASYELSISSTTPGRIFFFVNGSNTKVDAPLNVGEWSHVVGTFDSTTLRLYVNGTLVSTKPYSAAVKYSSQPLVIGAGGGRRSYWNGALDEIAIYERGLSAQEVLRHYRKGINGPSKMSPPAGMTINPATGVITWLPTETQVGQHEVVVEVSDGHGGLDQQAFVVRVEPEPGNRPPVFVSAPTTNVYLVPLSQLTNTITFESIPGDVPRTGLPISTQFWDSHGISFGFEGSGESLLLADVGPPRTAFVGYQGRADEPAPGQDVGTYFLTDDDQVGAPPPPIIITYAEPVSSAGAVIIDIDQDYEEWTIEARDIAGNVLDTIVLDPYSYPSCGRVAHCGLAVPWHFLRESADISSIRITYTGTSGGVGLAFDNFTTSRAGQEYSYDADAIDPDGDSLEYTLEEGPVGMLVDPTTGLLRWPLDARQVGEHAVRVRVSDGRGGFDVQAFSLTVRGQGTSEIRGTVFHDVNGDGDWMPPEEPGLEGWTVYLDANGDGRHDLGERSTVTHDDGTYAFGALPQGTYVVRQVPQPAWQQTEPLTRSYTVTLAADETVTGFDFGNVEQSAENRSPLFTSKPPDSADVDELTRYNAAAVDPDNDPLTFDLPLAPGGMTVHPQRGIVVWQPTRDQVGTHQVVVRVSDGRGGVALQPFEIIVVPPNSPPIITSTPPSPAVVDLPLQYPVRAQDADGDSLVFRTENAPAGVQINPQTGLLTWTPTSGQLGQHTFTVAVSDGRGGEARQAVAIDVVADAPNDPPVITSQPRLRARVGSPYGYLIEAHDPNGDPLTYHLDAAPAGMTVDDLGVVRWQPSAELRGTQQPVTVRVDDGRVGGVATQEFVLEVVSQDSNQAPWITSTPVLTGVSGRTYQYQLTARDPDGDPVMWSLDVAPAGMSIDPLRGTLRWTPAADQTGSHPVVVRVQDIFFAAGTQSFAVNVRATNQPPSIRSTPDVTASPDELYVYAVRAVDPDGDPLTFRGAVMPSGMTLDARSGLIQWTPTAADVGPHAVRVVVEDGQGGIDSQAYTLHVGHQPLNHPPVITSTPVYFATSERLYQYPVTAQDPDGGSIVFSLERNPAGMEIDAGTGVITWTPTAGSPADPTVTVVATDEAGARATQTYILTVRANQPPRIVAPPARSIAVGASYRYDVRATDPERDAITFELVAPPAGMSIDPQGRIAWQPTAADVRAHTIQIVARDSYGATDTASYALTVTADTEAPRVTLSASTPRVDWHGEVIFDVRATDNVGVELLSLSLGGTEVPLVFQNGLGRATVAMDTIGVFQAVATATDAAGNVGGSNIVDVTVRDPKDVQFPQVAINALEQSGQRIEGDDLYSVPTLTYLTDIIATINDTDLSAWWVDYARADLVNLNNVADSDPDYVRLAEGTGPVFAGVVGTLDPSLLANDSYVIRVSGMDLNGQISSEAILVAVSGQAKLGNFRFALTDLQIPLAGIPITITRIYDTLHAGEEGDFGYGWSLGIQDAKIRETVPANGEFIPGKTRVYLTTPDGRRVGFTYKEAQVPIWDLPGVGVIWQGFLGDKRYRMYFEPDPGVTEKLSIDQEFIERGGLSGAFYQLGSVLGGGVAIVNPNTYTLTTRDGLQYRYDQTAGLQYIRDLNGNTVTFSSTEIRHSTGGAIRLVRDARGRIMRIIDTADNSISYRYDARGDLVGVTNQIGETTRYVYRTDPAHFLEEVYDSANVRVFRAEFDDDGRLTSSVDALGGRVQQDFDLEAMTGTITDARGNVTTLWYDEQGNVTQEQSAPVLNPITGETVRYTKTYEYGDPRHPDKETKVVEYDGTIVEWEYDAAGNTMKTTQTSADGSQSITTSFTYDANNNLIRLTSPGGSVSAFAFSGGKVTSVTSALGPVAHMTYTADGKQRTFTDFNGNTTQYDYEDGCLCGTPRKVTHPDGSYELREWNRRGLVTGTEYYEADGTLVHVTTAAYDNLGRKTRETVGLGADEVVTTYAYDGSTGNVTRKTVVHPTDPSKSRVTHYFYDAAGHLIRQVDPDLDPSDPRAGIFVKYDASGNRVWLMDPIGNVTTWIYDSLNRVIEERDPLYWHGTDWWSMTDAEILALIGTATRAESAPFDPSHITRYAYDGAGNLIEQIDRNGRRRTFEYDHRGNLLAEVWYDAEDDVTPIRDLLFTYNAYGRMLTAVDPDAQYVFTYDALNQLQTMSVDYPWATDFDTFTLTYQYDSMANVISATDSTGVAVKSEYDSRNRLTSRWWEGDAVDSIRADFSYTAVDQMARMVRWGDKERTVSAGTSYYAYDSTGRVQQIVHKNAADEVLAGYDYDYDFSGLLTKETLTHINAAYSRTADYGYDQRGQLISALYDNDQEDEWYAYDANGNRTGSYLHGTGYGTGPANQLLSDGTFNYTYDHEGNMATKTRIAPVEGEVNYTEYEYDFRNLMTKVTQYSRRPSEGGIVLHEQSNRYDSLGRRIQVVSDAEITASVYQGASFLANEWARFSTNDQTVHRFLFTDRADQLIAERNDQVGWALTDYHGSIRDVTDEAGRIVQNIRYAAFGVPFFANPPGDTPTYAFTGREFDPGSRLTYYRARFVDTATGRFTNNDPLAFAAADVNLFRYAFNSPLRFTDATGLMVLLSFAATIKGGGQEALLAGIGALHGYGITGLFAAGAALQFAGADDFGTKVVAEVERQLEQLKASLNRGNFEAGPVKLGVGLAGGAAAYFEGVELFSVDVNVPALSRAYSKAFLGALIELNAEITIGVGKTVTTLGFFEGADFGIARLKQMFGVQ